MVKTYRYRLQPNRKQSLALQSTLDTCRELYNMGLEERKMRRVGVYEQKRELTVLKAGFPEYTKVHAHVLQNVLFKLDKAFQNFFRRCKSGVGKVGFPRFKGKDRFDSFQFNNTGFSLAGKYLQVSKIGNIKLRLSRELPKDAVIKTCTVKRQCGNWYACFSVEYTPVSLPHSDEAIGVDVGIENFVALSDGTFVQNPRFYQNSQPELRRAQRRVARRKKGSHRRRKAVILLQKVHQHTTNRRLDFLHKESTKLVQQFGTIVMEDLNIAGMSRSNLAKQILDVSWSTFKNLIGYKAAEAGRRLVEVNPAYTSQTCPECGHVSAENRKTQAEFKCVACEHSAHADTNGAVNILARMEPLDAKIGRPIPCLV